MAAASITSKHAMAVSVATSESPPLCEQASAPKRSYKGFRTDAATIVRITDVLKRTLLESGSNKFIRSIEKISRPPLDIARNSDGSTRRAIFEINKETIAKGWPTETLKTAWIAKVDLNSSDPQELKNLHIAARNGIAPPTAGGIILPSKRIGLFFSKKAELDGVNWIHKLVHNGVCGQDLIDRAVNILVQVADHCINIEKTIGRPYIDLKPQNILITEDGRKAYIIDFEQLGHRYFGTYSYRDPELGSSKELSKIAPWQIGVIFLNILTCENPFPGSLLRSQPQIDMLYSDVMRRSRVDLKKFGPQIHSILRRVFTLHRSDRVNLTELKELLASLGSRSLQTYLRRAKLIDSSPKVRIHAVSGSGAASTAAAATSSRKATITLKSTTTSAAAASSKAAADDTIAKKAGPERPVKRAFSEEKQETSKKEDGKITPVDAAPPKRVCETTTQNDSMWNSLFGSTCAVM